MKNLISLSIVLLFMSCSSKIVKKDRLEQVKTVAIIGLDLEQQRPISGADLVSAALKQGSSNKVVAGVREDSIHMTSVYNDIAEKISRKTGWKVIPLDNVEASKIYAQTFKEKTEGLQSRPFINERFTLFTVPALLDTFAVQNLKADTLKALAQDLRVDAVIVAKSIVRLNNSSMWASIVGQGQFHPSSSITLSVLDSQNAEKIFVESADGPELKSGEKNFVGMASDTRVNEMAQEATGLATDLIVQDL